MLRETLDSEVSELLLAVYGVIYPVLQLNAPECSGPLQGE